MGSREAMLELEDDVQIGACLPPGCGMGRALEANRLRSVDEKRVKYFLENLDL